MRCQTRIWAGACLIAAAAAPAWGGPIKLDFLLFELDYGVLADGGSVPAPLQGPVSITEPGYTEFEWVQEDGVALAGASAAVALGVAETKTSLSIDGALDTTAMAVVGDDDEYDFEVGIAESFMSQVLISISVGEQSVLSVSQTPAELAGYGTIEPGHEQILEPGLYDLTYPGGYATGSSVSVGANESAFDSQAWGFGVEVHVVPSPGAPFVLLLVGRRRRR